MINKFVLNALLHHVGTTWVICSNEEILYEVDEINYPDWLNKGPWYNTYICSRLNGSCFEDFISHARTDRSNLLCSLVPHYLKNIL